jgi:hypothetical protein
MPPTTHQGDANHEGDANHVQLDFGLPNTAQHAGRPHRSTDWSALLASQVCATPATINLPGERAFPENITATSDGTLFVGSLGAAGIYRAKRHTSKSQ